MQRHNLHGREVNQNSTLAADRKEMTEEDFWTFSGLFSIINPRKY